MIRQEINTKNKNFIGCWKIEDQKLFSGMIDFFEKNLHLQSKGVTGSGLNEESKKTTNITTNITTNSPVRGRRMSKEGGG